ncbi:hypothetical protein VNO80_23118 [Phaseolus coccineus]|uniref:Uncharacterized protein n=1 Tax=Phaseolus coccineus TaxID=3886 RepID=A0AAN9QSC4_PHACN
MGFSGGSLSCLCFIAINGDVSSAMPAHESLKVRSTDVNNFGQPGKGSVCWSWVCWTGINWSYRLLIVLEKQNLNHLTDLVSGFVDLARNSMLMVLS